MPASTDGRYSPTLGTPPAEVHLASWPLRDDGLSAWILLLGAAGLATLGGYLSDSLPTGLLCFAALMLAQWRLWLPIRYDLGPRGVAETYLRRTRRIPWSQIARYEVRRRGVLLHATHEPTPLRMLQARYVPWGRKRSEVLEMVRYYLDR
jgi:hypothetical protein